MKFLKVILKVLLPLLLIVITVSFIAENILVKTFSEEILAKKVSGYFLDEIVKNENDEKKQENKDNQTTNNNVNNTINQITEKYNLQEIQDKIRNSKYADQITSEFIQTVVANLTENASKGIDITEQVTSLVEQYIPEDIEPEKVEQAKELISEKVEKVEEKLEDNLIGSFGENYLIIMKIYAALTNMYLRIGLISLIIIDILILLITEKSKAFTSIAVCLLIVAILTSILFVGVKFGTQYVRQELTGGWINDINLNLMMYFIIAEFGISLILFTTRIITKLVQKNKIKGEKQK